LRVHKVPGKGFYARVGDFFGPLKEDQPRAIKALDEELESYHPLNHVYLNCVDGTVLHLFQMPSHGWNVYIIPPTGYKGQGIGTHSTYQQAKQKAGEWAQEFAGGIR